MKSPPIVVKIGGSTLGSHDTSLKDLVALQKDGVGVVVVHGGGNVISEWMRLQGVQPQFVNGLRVTDAASLEIVVAVLGGLINKELVSQLRALGGRAMGISGIDGGLLDAYIGDPDLGFVGEVKEVNCAPLRDLLGSGYIPIVAPLARHFDDGSENSGAALNMNGDTVAGELACALGASRLVFLTDVAGVMDGSRRVIHRLDRKRADSLFQSGILSGGMVPKVAACLRALEGSPVADIIDGREPGALMRCLAGRHSGTTIINSDL